MASPPNRIQQLKSLIASLSLTRRILIGATALALGAAILIVAYSRRDGDFRPLYTGLAPEDGGIIVQKLKEKGVPYRVSESGASVLVPAAKVAETRLELAGAGLPKSGRIGFELFDKTKFGVTDFTEHVNLRRALEGELERSIAALESVETARVHLTFPKESVFAENRLPAKGSVMLKLRADLSEQNVSAIWYLLASAVEGLAPEAVSVMDMKGNLLGRPKDKTAADGSEPSDALIEYTQQIEKKLVSKVNSTLEPLLGPDRFRASVVAECDFTHGEQTDEIVDPARSVITSEQRTKEVANTIDSQGVPGTASNLPRAIPRPGANTGVTKETSSVAYQSTRTVKHVQMPQGTIKRLSVSVLVDQTVRWEGQGSNLRRVLVPPSQETMSRITEVVSAATGIQTERGDKLVVESLPFEATLNQEPPPQPPVQTTPEWWKPMLIAVVIVLLLAAGAAYTRQTSRRKKQVRVEVRPEIAPPQSVPAPPLAAAPQTPAVQLGMQIREQQKRIEEEKHKALEAVGAELQQLTDSARELTTQDAELCAGVLRTWLNEAGSSS
jgi:flagellar M-ring protein FliF